MALYHRERDFSSATINTIKENLRGETEDYKEFSKFVNEYGDAFETVDLAGMLLPLDSHMTNARIFMSDIAPKELSQIEAVVFELDQQYASQCRETQEELKALNSTINTFTQMLQSKEFVAVFSSDIPAYNINLNTTEVIEGVKYVILDPAFLQIINTLLLAAGLAPLADGPLPFGDVVAVLILLVSLGIIVVGAFVSLCQWLYSMLKDSGKSKLKRKPVNLPPWSKLTVDMGHILSGHREGGNRGGPRNDRWPASFTAATIERMIRFAYEHAEKLRTQGDKVLLQGPSPDGNGVIQMWVNLVTMIIESAWPKS